MGWWPRDPDAFAAALIVVIVLGSIALVGLGRLALWVAGWPIWRHRPASLRVKPSAPALAPYVEPEQPDEDTDEPDGRTDATDGGLMWPFDQLELDRSKEAVLMSLIAAGWKTTDIRAVIKGGNDTIGAEIEAARAKLNAGSEPANRTPIVGRAVPAGVVFVEE